MTLEPYDGAQLDQLSLRLLDVVCLLRRMAAATREGSLEKVVLHDRKPLEWIARLETWAEASVTRVEAAALREQGAAETGRARRQKKPGRT
jgi:hypothetical protein